MHEYELIKQTMEVISSKTHNSRLFFITRLRHNFSVLKAWNMLVNIIMLYYIDDLDADVYLIRALFDRVFYNG